MSIVRTAIRIATRKALEGRTMLDDRIRDSSIDTLEDALKKVPATVALIYTEDTMSRPKGKDIWSPGTIDLVIVLSVAGAFTVKVKTAAGEEEEVTEYRWPTTDAGSELSLDIIERQIKQTLMDPGNEWSEIWKGFVTGIEYWNSQRGASSEKGTRFAARQITARLHTIDDPIPGKDPVGPWARLLTALEMDQTQQWGDVPAALRGLIKGTPLPADFRDAMQNGLTRAQGKAIGLGRVDFGQDGPDNKIGSYYVDELDPGRPE